MREKTIDEFLTQLAARVPTPGGGATAALHAAQAAALIAMVGRHSTGEKYAAHTDEIGRIVADADDLRAETLRLGENDAAAFAAVADAFRLPKSTDEESRRELRAATGRVDPIAERAEKVTAAVRAEIRA